MILDLPYPMKNTCINTMLKIGFHFLCSILIKGYLEISSESKRRFLPIANCVKTTYNHDLLWEVGSASRVVCNRNMHAVFALVIRRLLNEIFSI